MTDQPLPARPEIERMTLGSIMLDGSIMDNLRGTLIADDFSTEAHRLIWRACCAVYDAGARVDRITVFDSLSRAGASGAVGGLTYLVGLDDGLPERQPNAAYVTSLKDLTARRRIIAEAWAAEAAARDLTRGVDDILASFGTAALRITSPTSDSDRSKASTAALIAADGLDSLFRARTRGRVPLPWPRLDDLLSGLGSGQVMLLMGQTSRGKTSAALQMAVCAASAGIVPCVWTLEMEPRALLRRMLTQMSGIRSRYDMTADQRAVLLGAAAELTDNPVHFDSTSRNVTSFMAALRRIRAQHRLGFAVVDYLQLIRSTNRNSNRAQEVSDNSRAIKLAAMDLGIPIVVLSQVDRSSVKGGGKIGLHSAKESGDAENDADIVAWIDAPAELARDADTAVTFRVGKQREGPCGEVQMVFRPQTQTFVEVSS